jgi:hypothetical protein
VKDYKVFIGNIQSDKKEVIIKAAKRQVYHNIETALCHFLTINQIKKFTIKPTSKILPGQTSDTVIINMQLRCDFEVDDAPKTG